MYCTRSKYTWCAKFFLTIVRIGEGNDVKGDIRMIDFAHVSDIKDGGIDDGYLFGLRNLINFFTKLSQ